MASCSVFLNVSDIEKSIAFYEGLGFEVEQRHSYEGDKTAYADLVLDGAYLGLGSIQANDDPEFQDWVAGELGAGVLIYFEVEDVDAVHEKARELGATVEAPPEDRPYGRAFTLNDPDGYVVSFLVPVD